MALSGAALIVACGGGGTHPSPTQSSTPPPLEPIAYHRLGSGKLAFLRDGDSGSYVYVLDATARTATALAMGLAVEPALSPDGTRIAYSTFSSLTWNSPTEVDVSTKRLTGADSQRVSALPGWETSPSWSPDGQYLYFFASQGPGVPGGVYRQRVPASPMAPMRVLTDIVSDGVMCNSPSPVSVAVDGRLAHACLFGAIYVSDRDGADRRALVPHLPPSGGTQQFYAPTWSPDAQWLAFIEVVTDWPSAERRAELSVRILRADGSAARTVATTDLPGEVSTGWHNNISLAWSPDGAQIAFNTLTTDRSSHVFVVGVDGAGLQQLTTRPGVNDRSVTWVP